MGMFDGFKEGFGKLVGYWQDGCEIIGNSVEKTVESVSQGVQSAGQSIKDTFNKVTEAIKGEGEKVAADEIANGYEQAGGPNDNFREKIYDKDKRGINWDYLTEGVSSPSDDGPEF